jgi:hypothetical protein
VLQLDDGLIEEGSRRHLLLFCFRELLLRDIVSILFFC